MLQKTTDEALRAEDDLAEAIDLIWMLDAAVRGFDFDPDTPNGRAAAGMASTFELVVEKLKGVGERLEVKGPRASQSDIADSDSAQTFTATLDFELEFVAGFGGPDTAALAFAVHR